MDLYFHPTSDLSLRKKKQSKGIDNELDFIPINVPYTFLTSNLA